MLGEMKPDYARCVDIVTAGALREMVMPGLLAVGMPIAVGLILRAEAVAALLMVGTITGILLATLMNNSGGHGTMPRNTSKAASMVARAQKRIRPLWLGIPSAIPSRTPLGLRCMS